MFKESNSKMDWQANLKFLLKKPYKNKKRNFWAARGWMNAYLSTNGKIMEELIKIINKYTQFSLDICGWSYGGAIATLAAEDFNYITNRKANLITFGAPKAIFGEKSKNYILSCCDNVMQFSHVNDLVTYLAPLPGYTLVKRINIGSNFSFLKLSKPTIFHTCYGNSKFYKF